MDDKWGQSHYIFYDKNEANYGLYGYKSWGIYKTGTNGYIVNTLDQYEVLTPLKYDG